MRYTIFVRQIREVEIRAGSPEQLRVIMEQSFKPEGRAELEEWRIHIAAHDDGTIVSTDIDSFWRPFPEDDEDE